MARRLFLYKSEKRRGHKKRPSSFGDEGHIFPENTRFAYLMSGLGNNKKQRGLLPFRY